MQISARNTLKGTVKAVKLGDVEAEVTVEIAEGLHLTATITRSSAERLQLVEGKAAHVVIKASDVMIAID